jgi:adenylate cyclase
MIRNVPVLADAAAGVGVITLSPSVDAVVRKVPLFFDVRGTAYPSLALELMRAGGRASSYVIESDPSGIQRVLLGERRIPVDERGQFWVWYGPSQPDSFVSAQDLLAGRVAANRLQGKLVLVGTSATALGDIRATPVDGAVPGVEVHAQVVESVLGNEILGRPAGAKLGEMILTAIVAGAIIVLTPRYGPLRTLVMGAVAAATIAGSSAYAFFGSQLLVDPSFPLLASLTLFAWLAMANYFQEERQKRFIRRAFGQYLAPSMVENLSQDPTALRLGGETRNLTVMFCDLRGFTGLSERYADDPQGLTRLLNRFLTPLSYAVLDYNGTIDKYIGDSVMAFWNAPLDDPDHAVNATSAALRITAAVDDLNQALSEEARTDDEKPVTLRVAIGLNTGPCVAGNLGSDVRFNYSAIGDTVNLAARLEGLTRLYGVDIIVGERTALACSDSKLLLPLDRVRVKGKIQPERIHAVLGMRQPERQGQAFETLRSRHEQVLASCEAGAWARASEALATAQPSYEAFGLTTLAAVYAERVERLRADPQAAENAGIFDATQKSY